MLTLIMVAILFTQPKQSAVTHSKVNPVHASKKKKEIINILLNTICKANIQVSDIDEKNIPKFIIAFLSL